MSAWGGGPENSPVVLTNIMNRILFPLLVFGRELGDPKPAAGLFPLLRRMTELRIDTSENYLFALSSLPSSIVGRGRAVLHP